MIASPDAGQLTLSVAVVITILLANAVDKSVKLLFNRLSRIKISIKHYFYKKIISERKKYGILRNSCQKI